MNGKWQKNNPGCGNTFIGEICRRL